MIKAHDLTVWLNVSNVNNHNNNKKTYTQFLNVSFIARNIHQNKHFSMMHINDTNGDGFASLFLLFVCVSERAKWYNNNSGLDKSQTFLTFLQRNLLWVLTPSRQTHQNGIEIYGNILHDHLDILYIGAKQNEKKMA